MMPVQVALIEIAKEATVQRVDVLIRADRSIMTDSAATALGCSHGLAYSIMHNPLKFRKVCAQDNRRIKKTLTEGSVLATFLTVCR
jgi:hypothetical protein